MAMREERNNVKKSLEHLRDIDENVDVVNMSFGFPPQKNDSLSRNVNQIVEDEDIVPVVAAGNKGPDYFSITSPGIARKAVTVGSISIDGNISHFSSRGPTSHEFRVKPDIVAPGQNIEAEVPTQSGGTKKNVRSGTSMAAAVITGSIAQIREANPEWTAKHVKNSIITTAKPLEYDVYTQGAGLAQIDDAVNTDVIVKDAVLDLGHVQSGDRIEKNIRVENLSEDQQTISAEASIYEIQNDIDCSEDAEMEMDAVTLPGNSIETVQLEVDTTGHHGVHSGRIIYQNTNPDTQYTSIFGYVC